MEKLCGGACRRLGQTEHKEEQMAEKAAKQKTKTIALYIGSVSKGGAERVIINLADYFYRQIGRAHV